VLALALVCGAINGAVSIFLGLPSIVTSLFLMFFFTGAQYLLMEGTGENTIRLVQTVRPDDRNTYTLLLIGIIALLAIIAQSAPLLGLLGTIVGMARVVLAVGGETLVTRADLIGGAMQTLGAAAAGIVVAVSVQVMYGMLRVRLDRLTADLEAAASEILGILAAHREVAA
jgi:biopolymer transport protein ExbB/TolQ